MKRVGIDQPFAQDKAIIPQAIDTKDSPRLNTKQGKRERRQKPALITGGAGFIGANLAHRLLSEGRPVLIFDNLSRPGVERDLKWLRLVFTSTNKVYGTLNGVKLVGRVMRYEPEDEPAMKRSDYEGQVAESGLYTQATLRPLITGAAIAGGGLAVSALLRGPQNGGQTPQVGAWRLILKV